MILRNADRMFDYAFDFITNIRVAIARDVQIDLKFQPRLCNSQSVGVSMSKMFPSVTNEMIN